jgi:hypothetical protein
MDAVGTAGTTEVLSAQAVFDEVVEHLFKQGRPAHDDHGNCRYRVPGTPLMCAVGKLIRDDEYQERFDSSNMTVVKLLDRGLLPQRLVQHIDLLDALQDIHDSCSQEKDDTFKLEDLSAKLQRLADENSLVYKGLMI